MKITVEVTEVHDDDGCLLGVTPEVSIQAAPGDEYCGGVCKRLTDMLAFMIGDYLNMALTIGRIHRAVAND